MNIVSMGMFATQEMIDITIDDICTSTSCSCKCTSSSTSCC